jgi:protein TonB
LVYVLFIFLYITYLNVPKPIIIKPKQVIKIALITPPAPKIEPKPKLKPIVIPPKPKPKPKHKPKQKKKIKKSKPKPKPKPKPRRKKIVKRVKPKPIIEEVFKEEIIKRVEPIPTPPKVVKQPPPPPPPKPNLDAQKQLFLNKIRATINTNKKYPRVAKRRRIQGTVHVSFDILKDGTATNIHTSGASKVLQKAVKKSIKKSFPTTIPQVIQSKFPMRNVTINIGFIIE